MNANTTPNLDAALETIAPMYSGPSVYAALADGFTGTDTELTAHIGAGHIKSGVRTALNALKAHGVAVATKTDPSNNFSPTVWSLAPVADAQVIDNVDALDEIDQTADDVIGDRDAAFAAALAEVLGDDTDDNAGPALLDELMDLGPVAPAKPRKPRTNSKGQVRLLAVYPGDKERTPRGDGTFKTVRPNDNPLTRGELMTEVAEWLAAHPNEDVTVSRIGKELKRYPTAVARSIVRLGAKDDRYVAVEGAATRTFRFNA